MTDSAKFLEQVVKDLGNEKPAEVKEEPVKALDPLEEYKRLQELRSGGRYVPPAKLKALLDQINLAKGSKEFQKLEWEKLKKNINGLVNKANKANLKIIVVDLFKLNLKRGLGLLIRSIMKAQSQALTFTPVYAALVSVLNSKIPQIGELLISRLVIQFRKAFKRNNKALCISSTTFIAHLCNQQVSHEILPLQILYLLLNNQTDDSVDISVGLLKHIGLFLSEVSPTATSEIFEKLRYVLQEGKVEKRTQYMIEVLFCIRREGYKDYEIIPEGLDLVEEDDQIIHKVGLDDKLKAQDGLNVFQFDQEYEKHEEEYNKIRIDILGDDEDEEEEEVEYEDDEYEEVVQDGEGDEEATEEQGDIAALEIKDMTDTNLTNFRKTIYLILKGSMSADEAVHKLLKLRVKVEDQDKVVDMVVKACSQETTYSKYYGVTGEKLCRQGRTWNEAFQRTFEENYTTIHRLESNPLRNVSKFWGHLLSSDSLDWEALSVIKLTESDTTSAGRIFIKFILQELVEELGIPHLKERLGEEYIQPFISGIFPFEDADHLRFSINFFTAIGLGVLTERMRETLQDIVDKQKEDEERRGRSRSRSGSRSSYYSGSFSRSRSGSYSRSRSGSYSRSRSYTRSPSYSKSRSRSVSYSRSPPRRTYSRSPSKSPPRNYSRTPSRSPPRDSKRYKRDQSYSRSPPRRYSRTPSPDRQRSYQDRSYQRDDGYNNYNNGGYGARGGYRDRERGGGQWRGGRGRGRGRGGYARN